MIDLLSTSSIESSSSAVLKIIIMSKKKMALIISLMMLSMVLSRSSLIMENARSIGVMIEVASKDSTMI